MLVCVEGGSSDERAAIARALSVLDCEFVDHGGIRVAIAPPVRIDALAGVAIVGERSVRLTRIEMALLGCLINALAPLRRPALIARVWGYGFDPETNMVAVHVSRLRAKLGPSLTIAYRDGYLIEAATNPEVPARTPRNRTPGRRCN